MVGEISMTLVLSEKATAKIPLVPLVQYTLSSSSARPEAGRPGGEGGREGGREGEREGGREGGRRKHNFN